MRKEGGRGKGKKEGSGKRLRQKWKQGESEWRKIIDYGISIFFFQSSL